SLLRSNDGLHAVAQGHRSSGCLRTGDRLCAARHRGRLRNRHPAIVALAGFLHFPLLQSRVGEALCRTYPSTTARWAEYPCARVPVGGPGLYRLARHLMRALSALLLAVYMTRANIALMYSR